MAVVVFDATEFKLIYPEFNAVPDVRLQFFFDKSTLILSNTDSSIVCDIAERKILLYLLVAHFGYLSGALNNEGKSAPVGRLSNATEGSVSANFEYTATNAAQWFLQSQYGAEYWQMTLKYRTMRYVAPSRNCNTNWMNW